MIPTNIEAMDKEVFLTFLIEGVEEQTQKEIFTLRLFKGNAINEVLALVVFTDCEILDTKATAYLLPTNEIALKIQGNYI